MVMTLIVAQAHFEHLKPRRAKNKLEDLKVLRLSPDLLNNFKIRSRSATTYNEINFVLPYMGDAAILVK